MNDIRDQVYARYVSNFKKDELAREAGEERYHQWCDHKILPLLEGVDRSGHTLEIGCGDGPMMRFLDRSGFSNVHGVDLSQEMVDLAAKNGMAVKLQDAREALDSHENALELVVAIDVIEHFTKSELLLLLEKIHRALRPGGRFLFQAPNGQGLFPNQVQYGDLTHMTVLTPSSLSQLLTLSNFTNVDIRETGPAPTSWKSRVRLALWKLIRGGANVVRLIEAGKTQAVWTETMVGVATKA